MILAKCQQCGKSAVANDGQNFGIFCTECSKSTPVYEEKEYAPPLGHPKIEEQLEELLENMPDDVREKFNKISQKRMDDTLDRLFEKYNLGERVRTDEMKVVSVTDYFNSGEWQKKGNKMKYRTHSSNGSEIKIRIIEDGLIVTYRENLSDKEKHFDSLETLQVWLKDYYKEV